MTVDNKLMVECGECGIVAEGFLPDLELRGWEFTDDEFGATFYWLCPNCSSR